MSLPARSPRRRPPAAPRWTIVVEDGVHWLGTPHGNRIYGCGVNGVNPGYAPEAFDGRPAYRLEPRYPSADAWAATTRDRLTAWGFDHLGAWAAREDKLGLPCIPDLDLGRLSRALWFDPFDPALPARVGRWAHRLTRPHRELGLRIGYFPDNEVGWWNGALFTFYLAKDWRNETKRQLWRLLHDCYDGQWAKLLDDWVPPAEVTGFAALRKAGAGLKLRPGGAGIEVVNTFTLQCAERYYRLMHDALRAADPEALLFSDRLPIYYSQDAVRAMAPYVDAVAVNYNLDGPDGWVAHYFFDGLAALTGKAILVSEFFCAAMDNRSGNKNTGHLLTVATQAERAAAVERGLRNFARFPHVVGTHWFQYYDEPQGGRADGEDYNMGLVDIHDQPYAEVVAAFQRVNPALTRLHAGAGAPPPPPDGAGAVGIPRAARAIDVTDASLTDWDKDDALLRGFAGAPPHVPFADVYLTWDPDGLNLATIGMDYMHPEHLAHEGAFPISETYQLHLLVLVREQPHHLAVHFFPHDVLYADGEATNARGSMTFVPRLYTYSPAGTARPLAAGAVVQHLDASAPRLSCEARFRPELFRLPSFEEGMRLKMNIVLVSHYRAQEMFWTDPTAAGTFHRPDRWRPVILK